VEKGRKGKEEPYAQRNFSFLERGSLSLKLDGRVLTDDLSVKRKRSNKKGRGKGKSNNHGLSLANDVISGTNSG